MPFCTYCGQSFTRDEHLERHILTHTNVKPYKCFKCHMSFARRDLLHRHYTVHGRDGSQEPLTINGMIPKSAGRTPIACINCAKTKTKCDKKFPCTRCSTRNLECTVRPTRRALRNPVRPPAPMQGPMPSLEANPSPMGPQSAPSSGHNSRASSPPGKAVEAQWHPGRPVSADSAAPIKTPIPAERELARPSTSEQQARDNTQRALPSSSEGMLSPGQARITPTLSPVTNIFQSMPYAGFDNWMSQDTIGILNSSSFASSMYGMSNEEIIPPPEDNEGFQEADMLITTPESMAFGISDVMRSIQQEPIPLIFQHHEPGPGSMHTPVSGSSHERSSSDVTSSCALQSSLSWHHPTSSSSSQSDADAEAIVFGQNCWSAYRCTPSVPAAACPKSARINLQKLEQSLRDHSCWTEWRSSWDEASLAGSDRVNVLAFQEISRDKLLAITQTFLHKAFDIHSNEPGLPDSVTLDSTSSFIILPPARVLEHLLRAYASSFERFYPLVARGVLDPNGLMLRGQDKAASLLLLLMIAQGALITPSLDGRWLTAGLTEACRISLFDVIEKNIMMSGDAMVLHAALLFTVQAGWSGDKWQMDIATGQRGMYFSMLRHSGYLESCPAAPATLTQRSNIELLWQDWIQHETRSRLVYCWAMVDQDLSLFQDTAPMFSITEFGTPMPDTDALWHARSAAEWSGIFERVHEFSGGHSSLGSGARPLCLKDLFRLFASDSIVSQSIQMTPLHLRLLLHPLQSLLCQFRQLLTCLPNANFRTNGKTATVGSTYIRLEEVQAMLHRWYDLADRYLKTSPLCPVMQANMAIFHLVSLNACTDFPKIERTARREESDDSCRDTGLARTQCITDSRRAIFHCGQVLRLIRSMPRSTRPPWWAGAIYRVALIIWYDALRQNEDSTPGNMENSVLEASFPVDGYPPDHLAIVQYLNNQEGKPCLTRLDGSQMQIDNPMAVLFLCIGVISEGVSSRFAEGICSKLIKLARG